MAMTDAELRMWLKNPQWRAQLRRQIAEETSGSSEVAVGVPAAVVLLAPLPPVGDSGAAVTVGTPTVSASVGLAPAGEGLPEPPQVGIEAVREEDLADYEEETPP